VHGLAGSGWDAIGVYGESWSPLAAGVYGVDNATSGSPAGVKGVTSSTVGAGVFGYASATTERAAGVQGWAESTWGRGVTGHAWATSGPAYGVAGWSESPDGYGGFFWDLHVLGDLSVTGSKSFKIDHPLDPQNRYLYHYSTESSEVLNQYSGNVTLDADGEAQVQLATWFQAINTDFRYQLTPIGAAMPGLHIAQEIEDNSFRIAGGEPGMKVSWLITALRNDPYMQQNPQPVETEKRADERGLYQQPELYGQPPDMVPAHYLAPDEREP
jgi:hypothetical protein